MPDAGSCAQPSPHTRSPVRWELVGEWCPSDEVIEPLGASVVGLRRGFLVECVHLLLSQHTLTLLRLDLGHGEMMDAIDDAGIAFAVLVDAEGDVGVPAIVIATRAGDCGGHREHVR